MLAIVTILGLVALVLVAPQSAQAASSIGGVQLLDDAGKPVVGARVSLTSTSKSYTYDFATDAKGVATFTKNPAYAGDTFTVYIAPKAGAGLLPGYWDGKTSAQTVARTVQVGAANLAVVAKKGTAASITGTVTGSGSGPLKNVQVAVYTKNGVLINRWGTDASGVYLISDLPPDTYTLSFYNSFNPQFAQETWWKNKPSQATATYFDIAAGQAAKGRNIVLDRATTIAGSVRGAGSPTIPLPYTSVYAYSADGSFVGSDLTEDDGLYSIVVPAAGSYRLHFSTYNSAYVSETWWKNKPTMATADAVSVASQTTATADLVVPRASQIAGTVTGGGAPLQGVNVNAYTSDGTSVGYAYTDSAGAYSITGLAAGSYKLNFTNYSDQRYVRTVWWNNKPTLASAETITVTAGKATTGKNIALAIGATISGTVTGAGSPATPLANVNVFAYSGSDTNYASYGYTDSAGRYTIPGLAAGSYRLSFDNYSNSAFIRSAWFNGKSTRDTATVIQVTTAGTYPGRNALMAQASTLTGVVKNSAGVGIAGVSVPVWAASTTTATATNYLGEASTDSTGKYTLPGLAPGSYKVGFTDYSTGNSFDGTGGQKYQDEFYNNQKNLSAATPVTLTGGQTTTTNALLADKLKLLTTTYLPAVSGTAKVGQKLTAAPGNWSPAPVTFTYQWKSGGVAIAGATGSTYTVQSADIGHTLTVSATGSKTGYVPVTKTSAATAKVTG